ncbi:polysaccharide deacetylase family protein [Caulobacter mirabilis]|uniref:Chitooligosaccharide deacetylase n=1 Tax=Caulobacter mirabilis TaxID=69666 RepID=A0A2D2B139_9CAUL|nr:polysaccharide deacetylase family protein [Caulobacter mirabilis]ATQ43980.1 polysaccharide deacetylase [Caulobacter mirabilis]
MAVRNLLAALAAALLCAGPVAAQTRAVAVTIDDLPFQAGPEVLCDREKIMTLTRDLVATLKPLDTHATAFVNEGWMCESKRAELLPEVLNVWLDAGLGMGNHTATHINIHQTTAEAYLADVDAGEVITRPLLAKRGKSLVWFRHPFLQVGETPEKKTAIAEGLKARGYREAPVTIDNNDWMFAPVYRRALAAGDAARAKAVGEAYVAHMATVLDHFEPYSAELTGGREPAQVLLLHANELNRDWYPKIHALYLARGYRFVSLEEAMKDPIYARPDTWTKANGVVWLHRWTAADGRPVRWEPDPPKWIFDAYKAPAPTSP